MLLQGGRCGGKEGLNRVRQSHQEPFIHFTAHGRSPFFLLLWHLQEPLCFSNCWRNEAKSLFWCKFLWLHPAIHSMDNFIFSESSTGSHAGPGWLSDTEKWNSMALIVKCCSSSEEEQHTWTLLTRELLQLSFTGRMQINLPSAGFPLQALLLGVCQHQPKEVKGKSPFFLARGQWGNPVFLHSPQGFQSRGRRSSQTILSHYVFKTWGIKIRTGHTKSHLDLKPFWVYKVFPNLNCISSPDTCIEMYYMC